VVSARRGREVRMRPRRLIKRGVRPLNAGVRPHLGLAHVESAWSQGEAVRIARAILSGDLGVLEGCIPLASVAPNAVPDWRRDPDFVVFGAVASEIDNLPFGPVRERWGTVALARADVEIARYSRVMRERIMTACRHVVDRFGAGASEAREGDSAV